jgi:hypothetical protein
MQGGDMGGGVTSPSSSSSSEESNSVGLSSPRSFTAQRVVLRALFLSFHTCIFFVVGAICLSLHHILGQAYAPRCAAGTPKTVRKITSVMRR